MGLDSNQRTAIRSAIARQDIKARIILFGPRGNDRAKGGDIDLLIISDQIGLHQE